MKREDRELHIVYKMNIRGGFVSTVFEGYGNKSRNKACSLMLGKTIPDKFGNYYTYVKLIE